MREESPPTKSWTGWSRPRRSVSEDSNRGAGWRCIAQRRALRGVGARPDPRRTRSLPRQRPPPPRGVTGLLDRAACSALISEDEELLQAAGLFKLEPAVLLEEDPRLLRATRRIFAGASCYIIFTSGAPVPKAALHTFGNHYHSALGSNANIALRAGDRWLHSLPLYHVGGLSILFRCLLAGATVALRALDYTRRIHRRPRSHARLARLTQLSRLLREDADLGGLEAVLMGGGPVPPPS